MRKKIVLEKLLPLVALLLVIGVLLSGSMLAGTWAKYAAWGEGTAQARFAAWDPDASLDWAGKTIIMQRAGGQYEGVTLPVSQDNSDSEVTARFSYAFTRGYPAAKTAINATGTGTSQGWMQLSVNSGAYGDYSTAGTTAADTLLYGAGPLTINLAIRFDRGYAKDNKPAAVGENYYEIITLDWLAEQVD